MVEASGDQPGEWQAGGGSKMQKEATRTIELSQDAPQ
jgi:hypothetical protein